MPQHDDDTYTQMLNAAGHAVPSVYTQTLSLIEIINVNVNVNVNRGFI